MKKVSLGNMIYTTFVVSAMLGGLVLMVFAIRSFGYSWLEVGLIFLATILLLCLYICFKFFFFWKIKVI